MEFRIGNIVFKNKMPHVICMDDFIGGQDRFDLFEPISLTEKIILNSGFELIKRDNPITNSYFYSKDGVVLNVGNSIDKRLLFEYPRNGNGYNFLHVEYVHQFQNLYFDLKNEELAIKM